MARGKSTSSPNATVLTSPFYVRRYFVLVVAAILVCYAQAIGFEFLPTDDTWLIALNLERLRDIRNLPELFSESTYRIFYRPVLHLSYMIDAQIPLTTVRVMHISNIIYHVLVCFALFHFLRMIEIKKGVAAIICFVFALHPINVQAVAWISGRNDSLLALFILLSCISLMSYFKTKDAGRLLLHFVFFALALLTKETAIVIPLLYVLLIVCFIPDWKNSGIFYLVPAWIVLCAGRIALQLKFVPGANAYSKTFTEMLFEFFNGIIMQVGKILLPLGQSAYPVAEYTMLLPYLIVIAAFVFLVVKYKFKNKNIAFFGFAWFAILMIIPTWFGGAITPAVHYEHRVYSALPGFLLMVSQLNVEWNKLLPRISVPLLLIAFLFLAVRRESVYRNYSSFVSSCIDDAPGVAMFHDLAGLGFQENKRHDQAVICFNEALKIDTTHAEYFNHRGVSRLGLKQYRPAIDDFEKANRMRPFQRETSYNLSLAYYYVKEYGLALEYLEEADSLGAYIAAEYAEALNKALLATSHPDFASE